MNFGEMVNSLRIARGKTLRQFCVENGGIDPSNWSKIERGVNLPPKDENTLAQWAKALGLKRGTPDWQNFMEQADISRGQIPKEIMNNEKLLDKLPIFFRTVRGAELNESELDDFIKDLRKAYTSDAKRSISKK